MRNRKGSQLKRFEGLVNPDSNFKAFSVVRLRVTVESLISVRGYAVEALVLSLGSRRQH
jgi:hypothetical protein